MSELYLILCCALFFFASTKRWKLVLLTCLLMLRCMSAVPCEKLSSLQGRVVTLYEKSFVVQADQHTVLVVSDEDVLLDSIVLCQGKMKNESDASYFFETKSSFDAVMFCDSVELICTQHTLRSFVHLMILSHPDESNRDLMMKVLLRCFNDLDTGLQSTVFLGLLMMVLRKILRYFFSEKPSMIIEFVLLVFFASLWSLEMTFLRLMYFQVVRYKKISFYPSIGLYIFVNLIVDPYAALNSSFWFVLLMRLVKMSTDHKQISLYWMIVLIQLCFYASCDVMTVLLNPVIQLISMVSVVLCFAALIFPFSLSFWISFLVYMDEIVPSFELHGTCSIFFVIGLILLVDLVSMKRQFIVMMISIVLISVPFVPKVMFLNAGQGDCILIQIPYQFLTVLIDTGPPSDYDQIQKSLYAQSVYDIDLLILTHQDLDHSGNKEELMQDFHVKEIWDNTMDKKSDEKLKMIQINDAQLTDSENDRSLMLVFSLGGLSFLFSGDAGALHEERAVSHLNETMDICKIAHHGSNTSTSMNYLNSAGCSVAVISAGINNRYGHPHEEVLFRLHKNGSTLLNTQIHGDIQILLTRFFNLVTTSSHEFGIIH